MLNDPCEDKRLRAGGGGSGLRIEATLRVGLTVELCVELPTGADDEAEGEVVDVDELRPLCTEFTYAVGFPDSVGYVIYVRGCCDAAKVSAFQS